jgi:glycosyltransferase involved in cell wall biosynthesis
MFSEILPRMCEIDPTLQITLFTSGRCHQELPLHSHIDHQALLPIDDILRPRRLWLPVQQEMRRFIQQRAIKPMDEGIWHSTYFTLPPRASSSNVVTVYDMIIERFPEMFTRAYDRRIKTAKRNSVLAADKVICISETTRKDVQSYYGVKESKLEVIPLGYNQVFQRLEDGKHPQKPPTERPFLLYVGRRGHYKNFELLLQTYRMWPQQKDVDLVVVGPNWTVPEQRLLLDWGYTKQVHLLQGLDDEFLACLYNQALAFVYPSLFEGFGIPLLEAMACACPVVASRIPSTLEVGGELPFYFEPTDPQDLIKALDCALTEGRTPARMEASVRHVQQYSWENTAARTLQVYGSLS